MGKIHAHFNGRLGRDPEVREVGQSRVASLNLAVTEKWKNKQSGELQERTTWIRTELWNAAADIAAKYLKKGDMVGIHGSIYSEKYTKDGVEKEIWKCRVSEMDLLPNKNAGGGAGAGGGSGGATGMGFGDIEEDIPF